MNRRRFFKALLSLTLALLILIGNTSLVLASSSYLFAKRLIDNLYTGGGNYPPIRTLMLRYLLKAVDDPVAKRTKTEDDLVDTFKGRMYYKSPHLFRMDMEFLNNPVMENDRLILILNGEHRLTFKEGYPKPLTVGQDEHVPFIPQFPFYGLLKYEENLRYKPFLIAEGMIEGKRVWIISIIDSKLIVEKARVFVDEQTYLPLKFVLMPKKDRPEEIYLYRGVMRAHDGRFFPTRILTYVNIPGKGRFIKRALILKEVVINKDIPDSLFESPIKEFLPPQPPGIPPMPGHM